jgi:uncharacterized peroxidase-related enzyme
LAVIDRRLQEDEMAYIELGVDEPTNPGINGLLAYRPETAKPLTDLANALLHAPNSLTRGERELIAAYISGLNRCRFCSDSHSAFAAAQLEGGSELVASVHADVETARISRKLRALLRVAGVVVDDPRNVTQDLIDEARAAGAVDTEVHDTVLIAAAFCMYNRYVDGLGTRPAHDPKLYDLAATRIVEHGYGA